jgi:hypothetical protein
LIRAAGTSVTPDMLKNVWNEMRLNTGTIFGQGQAPTEQW